MKKKIEGDLNIEHVRFWDERYITGRKPFMSNIYDFPDVYDAVLRSPTGQIETEVNSIRRLLAEQGITKGSILELACGTCGHGILLAQGGFSVTGIDINPNMLEGAQRRMDTVGVKIKLIRGDMVDFDLGAMRFDCVIFMAETFPIITTYEDIKSHFRSVKRHLKPGGLYIIDMDAQNKIRTSSETGIWGKKTVRLDNGYVVVWHEDFPGDWVEGINRLVMHCRIYVNDTIYETTDDWSIRYYSSWMLSVLMQTLEGWNLKGFFSRRDLSQDIAEETHYFTVLEKAS